MELLHQILKKIKIKLVYKVNLLENRKFKAPAMVEQGNGVTC